MKRLVVLLALVVIAGLFMPGDSKASDNEITNSTNQTDSATLTITMITPPLPEE